MRFPRLASIALLVAVSAVPAGGQSLSSLPRSTRSTGLNDSTLVMVADSAHRTRAAVLPDFRKALSLSAFDSLFPGKLKLQGSTVSGSATWTNLQTFAANQRVDSATGAARASALVGSPAITVSSCTGCGGGTTYPLAATDGAANAPSIGFANSTGLGLYRFGADTLGISTAGTASYRLARQGLVKLAAGAGAQGCGTVALGIFPGANGSSQTNTGIVLDTTNAGRIKFCDDGTVGLTLGSSAVSVAASNGLRLANGAANSPSLNFTNSTTTGFYRFGADTLGIATGGVASLGIRGGASPTLFGGAGNLTIQSGTGNSRTMTLQSTTSAGTVKNNLVLGADSSVAFIGQHLGGNGSNSAPSYSFTNSANTGFYLINNGTTDTLDLALNGGSSFRFYGDQTAPSMMGSGSGSMTITAGTGTDRTMTLRSSNSGGTATAFLVGKGDTSQTTNVTASNMVALSTGAKLYLDGVGGNTYFNNTAGSDSLQITVAGSQGPRFSGDGRIIFGGGGTVANPALRWNQGGHVYGFSVTNAGAPDTVSITVDGSAIARWVDNHATAAGDVAVCITTTNVITKGATCGSSSAKVKTDIAGLLGSTATSRTMALVV